VFAYRTSCGGKYFGDHPDRSMYTFGLCVATARASSCQGNDGCAMMIVRSGKSTATSSSSIGFDSPNLMPPPPGRPAPMPVCPVWNSAGTPSSSATSSNGWALRSLGANPCSDGWNLMPRIPRSTRERNSRAPVRPFAGSTLANGISTSGCSAAASAISSLEMARCPVADSTSTVNTTAAIRRSR
jgi:hypothetical protein